MRIGAALAALVVTGVPSSARAEGMEPTPATTPATTQRDLARDHFKQGRAHQDARAYDLAIVDYQAAYALAPMPEMLFNIGQCYRLKGDAVRARVYYERYLQQVPAGGASADARAHIAAMRSPDAAAGAGAPTSSTFAGGTEPGTAIRGGTSAGGADESDGRAGGWRTWRWIGMGTVIAGAAFVGGGVWSGFEAADAADQLESARGPVTPELLAIERAGQDAEDRVWLFTGVGAALVVAGGVTWWLAGRKPDARRSGITAAPVFSPDRAGLFISGTF